MAPAILHQALNTRVCELFGTQYPIVQTGMGWVATPELVIAASNAGAMGILAASMLSLEETDRAIDEIKEGTDRPFGVNMRGDLADISARADALIKRGVRVASFALAPNADVIKKLKDAGMAVVPSIGALRHAVKVAGLGVDAVLVQGGEGGGHTGSVPTSVLVSQVSAEVDIPVIAAGGFRDGRGLVSAMALGADGIAMGTRFLLTKESPVPDAIKQVYLDSGVNDTVVTTALDGVPQRVLRTQLVERLLTHGGIRQALRSARQAQAFQRLSKTPWHLLVSEGLATKRSRELTWTQTMMAANTAIMTRAGLVDGRLDLGTLPSGQVAGVIDDLPTCAELVNRIMAEADRVLSELTR